MINHNPDLYYPLIYAKNQNFYFGFILFILWLFYDIIKIVFLIIKFYDIKETVSRGFVWQNTSLVNVSASTCTRKRWSKTYTRRFKETIDTYDKYRRNEINRRDSPDEVPWADDGLASAWLRRRLCQSRGWEDQRSGLCCYSRTSVSRVS